MAREKAGAARDVERPRRSERRHVVLELCQVFVPAGPVPLREPSNPEVPLVVFEGAMVVVLLHHFSSWHRLLIDWSTWTARRGSCLDRSPSATSASGRRIRTRSSIT